MNRPLVWAFLLVAIAPIHAQELNRSISYDIFASVAVPIASLAGSSHVDIPVAFTYQQKLTDHLALSLTPTVEVLLADSGESYRFQPWIELDYHPADTGLAGFYVGVAALADADLVEDQPIAPSFFLGIAPVVGYQLSLSTTNFLDFAFGLGVGWEKTGSKITFPALDGLRPDIGFGYRF